MQRDSQSHKGENGKVAIVGGSAHMHGAPILSALAAEAAGVDLLTVCLPRCHAEAANNACLNCFVHPLLGDNIAPGDVKQILELLATMDCAVIGPGVARIDDQVKVLLDVLAEASCPLVVDASALQPETLDHVRGKTAVLTPHLGELERMGLTSDAVADAAQDAGVTMCIKGPTDRIVGPDGSVQEVTGGNAGLTVGGTGDVLAGTVAGLMAQGLSGTDAAMEATSAMKKAGEILHQEKGFAYTAQNVVHALPQLLK